MMPLPLRSSKVNTVELVWMLLGSKQKVSLLERSHVCIVSNDGVSAVGLCFIRMVDAEFSYTYEYQGNAPKLVHTPLTDKCYLTLTQGMFMGLGGNPYGPAGTGKTESVKALGGLFGRQVLVFNCDEVRIGHLPN